MELFGAESLLGREELRATWARFERLSATPAAMRALWDMNGAVDVTHLLPEITVPTLVLHRAGDVLIPRAAGEHLAREIPDARLGILEGSDHARFLGNSDAIVGEVEEFLTGVRNRPARRSSGRIRRPSFGWSSLTPAERRVTELVAEGLSNAEIAAKIFVSVGTVKTHLAHIYRKLCLHGRAGLAVEAIRRQPAGELNAEESADLAPGSQ